MVVTEDEPWTDRPQVTITMLGLLDGHKGRGLGKTMVRYALHQALKQNPETEISLCTSEQDRQNGRATKVWYEKLGFEKTGEKIDDPAALIAAAVDHDDLGNVDLFNSYIGDAYSKKPNGKTAERYTPQAIARRLKEAFS
jgi:ribosomal protein S18 acetylase RimI-like enzyme